MVYNGKSHWNRWFGGTQILGNLHFENLWQNLEDTITLINLVLTSRDLVTLCYSCCLNHSIQSSIWLNLKWFKWLHSNCWWWIPHFWWVQSPCSCLNPNVSCLNQNGFPCLSIWGFHKIPMGTPRPLLSLWSADSDPSWRLLGFRFFSETCRKLPATRGNFPSLAVALCHLDWRGPSSNYWGQHMT